MGAAQSSRMAGWSTRISAFLLLSFVLQTVVRLVLIAMPFQRVNIEVAAVHALDLVALGCLAIILLRFARGRKPLQLVIALTLGAVGMMLSAFDISTIIAAWFHQRVPVLATLPIFYCNAEQISGCIRPFPVVSATIFGVWLFWSWLIYLAADALAEQSKLLLRPLTVAGRFPRLPYLLIALFLAIWGGLWMSASAEISIREPLVRFVGKTPFGPEPRELLTVPRPDYQVKPTPSAKPRTLVLISVDSLRADAVELAADKLSQTPFLQSLAASGKLHDYGPAVAICPTSYCGITGLLSSSDWATLQKGPPLTIADVLAANGYQSHYLLSGPHRRVLNLASLYGPNITSMQDDSSSDSSALIDDREQVRRLKAIKIADPARSFFFIHLMSAHAAGLRFDGAKPGGPYRDYYAGGVKQADMIIGQLFETLRARGLLDNALVIITADHGERLDGETGHGGAIDLSTAQIPLLVYDPKGGTWPRAAGGIASQTDAAPTLLNAVGIDVPAQWRGRPLQSGTMRSSAPTDNAGQSALVGHRATDMVMIRCDLKTGDTSLIPSAPNKLLWTLSTYRKWSREWDVRKDAERCRNGRS